MQMIDFQLENRGDPAFYAQVMGAWETQPGYGLIARCPGCGQFVWFGVNGKQSVSDLLATGLPQLPDDWHLKATIV